MRNGNCKAVRKPVRVAMINREVIEKLLREDVRGDCVVEVELAGQKFQLEILEIKRVNIGDGKPRTSVKVEPVEVSYCVKK